MLDKSLLGQKNMEGEYEKNACKKPSFLKSSVKRQMVNGNIKWCIRHLLLLNSTT